MHELGQTCIKTIYMIVSQDNPIIVNVFRVLQQSYFQQMQERVSDLSAPS